MFIFNLTYVKPLSDVDHHLSKHIEFLNEHYEKQIFVCSGRKIPRTGGIILCNCSNLKEAKAIMKKDPFYKEGIAKYEIIEFVPSKTSKEFEAVLAKYIE